MAAWRPRRCRAIRPGGEPGTTGACYGCALDVSGASGPREWTASRRWTWLRRSRTCAAGAAGARAGSTGTWGVRAKGTTVAETRRSRRTCVVAQRSRRLGATTVEGAWHGGAAWRLPWRTRRRHAVSDWCSRARRARRVRAGRAGRGGTPGVCRRRRWSSASAPGRVRRNATGVDAPGRVRGLGHGHDDNDRSCNNSGDGKIVV
ncbi:hypothetical protein VPH35_111579 [Triticum aestivum]